MRGVGPSQQERERSGDARVRPFELGDEMHYRNRTGELTSISGCSFSARDNDLALYSLNCRFFGAEISKSERIKAITDRCCTLRLGGKTHIYEVISTSPPPPAPSVAAGAALASSSPSCAVVVALAALVVAGGPSYSGISTSSPSATPGTVSGLGAGGRVAAGMRSEVRGMPEAVVLIVVLPALEDEVEDDLDLLLLVGLLVEEEEVEPFLWEVRSRRPPVPSSSESENSSSRWMRASIV